MLEQNDKLSYYKNNEIEIKNVLKKKNSIIMQQMLEITKLKEKLKVVPQPTVTLQEKGII